jgi:hypothetical protein
MATYEIGGVAVLSFDAHGAAAVAWAPPTTTCATGTWAPFTGCAGVGTRLGYGRKAYGRGPWPIYIKATWDNPADACGTGSWNKQRLTEMA